jgi:hypothetical protein
MYFDQLRDKDGIFAECEEINVRRAKKRALGHIGEPARKPAQETNKAFVGKPRLRSIIFNLSHGDSVLTDCRCLR